MNIATQNQRKINLLIIEDDQDYATYIKMILERESDNYNILIVPTLKEAMVQLTEEEIDFVISDIGLPDSDGLVNIENIQRIQPEIPILILTNVDDNQLGIEAINRGASDYLAKRNVEPQLLHRMILYGLERNKIMKELEENKNKLLRVQKMEAIVTLVGGVSHDFNNIITLINGYAELISNQQDIPPKIKKYNREIIKASNRAARLIGQLSTFSNTESNVPRPVAVNQSINNTQSVLSKVVREDVDLKLELRAEDDTVYINSGDFEQILLNIILNSRQAIDSTGTITISTKNMQSCPYGRSDGKVIFVQIKDTGSGIPSEDIDQIFDPYFTTRKQGTGLGLSTVYGLIKQAGGYIDVESTVGEGTTMNICLPYYSEEKPSLDDSDKLLDLSIEVDTLLIIDDEEQILELLEDLLSTEGYEIITKNNPVDALKSIENGSVDPDFVISDIVMPQMSGIDLYTEIRKKDRKIPILLMSGYSSQYYKKFSDNMLLLKKPFSKEDVLQKINETINYAVPK